MSYMDVLKLDELHRKMLKISFENLMAAHEAPMDPYYGAVVSLRSTIQCLCKAPYSTLEEEIWHRMEYAAICFFLHINSKAQYRPIAVHGCHITDMYIT